LSGLEALIRRGTPNPRIRGRWSDAAGTTGSCPPSSAPTST